MSGQDQQQVRHRATSGRGFGPPPGHEPHPSGPLPDAASYVPPRREGGRHRAPDAQPAPPNEFAAVPLPRPAGPDSPASGFRPLPPLNPIPTTSAAAPAAAPSPTSASTPWVPAPRLAPGSGSGSGSGDRPFNAAATPTPAPRVAEPRVAEPAASAPAASAPTEDPEDEPVTVPVRRRDLDAAVPRLRAAGGSTVAPDVAAPSLRPLAVRPARDRAVHPATFGTGTYGSPYTDSVASRRAPGRTPAPWTDPTAAGRTRWGLAGIVVGLVGIVLGLAPWSGLLPRILPQTALGTVPVFSLVGALLGVLALGLGAIGMFRAEGVGKPLLFGVLGTCAGAAATLVGLVV
ncbi:hypothetical protein [Actinomycetospora atypica]|uniref:Uncharacterized protein n=1 Tax=Actinomycetospora atypica TaxID=1290095 RepID=A0ABV9YFS2_9PSEU